MIASYGMATINVRSRDVIISYTGNMGAQMSSVEEHVDAMLSPGAFNLLKEAGVEDGSPDYLYTLKIKKTVYNKIIKNNA